MRFETKTHVTETEKRHIKAFLASGMTSAKVNTKYYAILEGDLLCRKIAIKTKKTKDYKSQSDSFDTTIVTVHL